MSEERIAELEAEIALRGEKLTAIDEKRAAAEKIAEQTAVALSQSQQQLVKSQEQFSALKQQADQAIAKLTGDVKDLQQQLTASKAETSAANAKIGRLLQLHQRAGQLLSGTAKAMQDEINYRNGIDLATGE